jgi:hypothetical protein
MLFELIGLLVLSNATLHDSTLAHVLGTLAFLLGQTFVLPTCIFVHGVRGSFFEGLMITNLLCFPALMLGFYLHSSHCVPLAHSFFAVAEWTIVFTNAAFHAKLILRGKNVKNKDHKNIS